MTSFAVQYLFALYYKKIRVLINILNDTESNIIIIYYIYIIILHVLYLATCEHTNTKISQATESTYYRVCPSR